MLLNRPYRSTDNGIVERGHGVLSNWVEADKAQNDDELQQRVDWAVKMQRERYPVYQRQTRLQVYPALSQTERPFCRADEAALWQFERVQQFLSEFIWTRRVDKVGRISLFSATYSVGRAYHGHDVHVQLDPTTHEWVIESEQGQSLKRYPCHVVTPERIYDFDLSKRANKVAQHAG